MLDRPSIRRRAEALASADTRTLKRALYGETQTVLGAAERLVNDFFWSRGRFKIRVFDLFSVRRGQGIDEAVERDKVAAIGTLNGLVHPMIPRNENGVGTAHVGKALDEAGFSAPLPEPFLKRLTAGKHLRKRLRVFSTGDLCQVAEEQGEVDLLLGK